MLTESARASIALIEKELADRPVGATLRGPVAVRPAAPPTPLLDLGFDVDAWRSALPTRGPRPCVAGCGSTVDMPGLCSTCGSARARDDARAEFKAALDSIPEKFRWARADSENLDAWCGSVLSRKGRPLSISKEVVPRIVGQLLAGVVRNYTLRGKPDAGKTSIACASMQAIIDRAVDAWIVFSRQRRVGRRSIEMAEPAIVTLARGARFVATRDLAPPRDRGPDAPPPAFATAIRATLLVLDDVGQEVPKRDDSFNAADRLQATRDVVTTLWDAERSILLTTFLSDGQIFELYAGGVQKRIVKSKNVAVIEIHGGKDV